MAESQEPYPYTAPGIASLQSTLSEPRLSTYMDYAQRNPELAMAFYLWNARLSKAMRFPLEITEVTVRNEVHYALCDRWGPDWPKATGFREAAAAKTLEKLDKAYTDLGANAATDKIVAALSFGFWPAIFKGRFPTALWEQRVDRFFRNLTTAPGALDKVGTIRSILEPALVLRNRIGHLEPILKRNLSEEHANLIKLVSFTCRKTAGWMKAHSTLNVVLRNGPNALVAEPFFMRRAIKDFQGIKEETTLKEAAILMAESEVPFVLVDGKEPTVLSRTDIGNWLISKASDGIVDLDEASVAEVAATGPRPPIIARSASLTDLRTALANDTSRFAIVTETGAPHQKVLAIVDVLKLLA